MQSMLFPVREYTEFLYLNRGYAFFAPDPVPSNLFQAAFTDGSGKKTEKLFPDRNEHWPRLLYHRHFMLAEFLAEIYVAPGPPEELFKEDPLGAELWKQNRARYEHVRQSIVDHLMHRNPGDRVVIRRVEHVIPSFIEFTNDPIELSDLRLYRPLRDISPLDIPAIETTPELPEAIPTPKATEPNPSDVKSSDVKTSDVKTSDVEGSDVEASQSTEAVPSISKEVIKGDSSPRTEAVES